jgi:hypothetical protein
MFITHVCVCVCVCDRERERDIYISPIYIYRGGRGEESIHYGKDILNPGLGMAMLVPSAGLLGATDACHLCEF